MSESNAVAFQRIEDVTSKYKSTEVNKDLEPILDVGNLVCIDKCPLDQKLYKNNKEEFLHNLSRDNTQLLINKIWQIPSHVYQDAVVVKLPDPTIRLPREKHIPIEKPMTKWQQYVKDRSIQKRKKTKMVWDEEVKKWVPRWGFKKVEADKEKDWLIVVPENADPYEDQYEKKKEAKKERVAKNELQRLRNIARAHKIKVPGVGLTPTNTTQNVNKDYIGKAIAVAKTATASLGKFQPGIAKEKPQEKRGKKRKFDPVIGDMEKEKRRNLDILAKLNPNVADLDVNTAIKKKNADKDGSEPEPSTHKKQGKVSKQMIKTKSRKFMGKRGEFDSKKKGKGGPGMRKGGGPGLRKGGPSGGGKPRSGPPNRGKGKGGGSGGKSKGKPRAGGKKKFGKRAK